MNQPHEDPRLDRIPEFDERSRQYPIRSLVEALPLRSYTWNSMGVVLDQGVEGACVGFSIAHELAAMPVPIANVNEVLARRIYSRAKQLDEWPGEAYSGTSVLAGMKAAVEMGYFGEYRWAFGEADLALAIGYKGPAVLGIPWYEGMMHPDAAGYLRPTGTLVGGHAIMCHSISITRDRYAVHNSWGKDWGINGNAYIKRADMRALLAKQGEACIPLVRKRPA